MMARLITLFVGIITGAVLVGTTILVATHVLAQNPNAPAAVSQVLAYQGRLLSPSTGQPQPDSVYQITFSLYNAATGGSALWTETKSVTLSNGLFSTLLGDTTPLVPANFNGQELFLGVKVGDDAEATPRQRLAHAAYAMWAENAGTANTAINATNATNATHATNADNATNAAHATNADNATNAAHATNADNATNATHATNADNATNATNATNTTHATNADNATSATNATTAANAQTLDNLDSTAFAAANHTHATLPIAYGFINADGTKSVGTSNVSSTWNATNKYYQIPISGVTYSYSQFVTVVTLLPTTGCTTATAGVGSINGNTMIVSIYDSAGALRQCAFQFVTFKP